jgi:hypothetical protein
MNKKLTIGGIAAGVILLLIVNVAIISEQTKIQQNATNYSSHSKELEVPVGSEICQNIKKSMVESESVKFAADNMAKALGASKKLTIWNASSYVANSIWVRKSSTLLDSFNAELDGVTNSILMKRIEALPAPANTVGLAQVSLGWGESFRDFVIQDCNLSSSLSEAKETISKIAGFATAVQLKAASKPWYPKGFSDTGFEGFAFLPLENYSCQFSFGTCAKFKIVSRTDCLQNLYVKTNLLRNGEVVDWSNDTAVVRSGQVAVMETNFSSDTGGSWQIVEISCY